MTTDTGCGVSGSAIQMGSPVTGQGYAIVDDQSGALNVWNQNQNYSVFKVHSNGEWDMEGGPGDPDFVVNGNGNGNGSYEGNGTWGIQPRWAAGWSMVTSLHGYLNAQPESPLGSIHANDYYDRASGERFSQVAQQVNNQQGQINNLNQGPCSTGYNSLSQLCSEIQSFGATNMGKLLATGTQGPVTSGHWGWCWLPSSHRYIRCWQTTPSPPTVNLTASSAPELVFADASAGIGQGGCGGSANTKQITLSATSGGAPIAAQSAQYAKGGSNYNPIDMYFPFSLTFTLPAGQSGQIQLTGGENGLGCGSIQYAVYQL